MKHSFIFLLAGLACHHVSAQNLIFTSGYSSKAITFLLDLETGLLSSFGEQIVEPNLTFAATSNGNVMYVAHEVSEYQGLGATGAVSRWLKGRDTFGRPIYKKFEVWYLAKCDVKINEIHLKIGTFFKQTLSANGTSTCHVYFQKEKGLLHVSNYGGPGSFTSFKVSPNGEITSQVYTENYGKGSNVVPSRQEDSHAHGAWALGPYVYVADLGSDKIWHYKEGPGSTIEKADPEYTSTPPGYGPRHMAFHDELNLAYVVFELQSKIGVYSVDPRGALTEKFMVNIMPEPSTSDYAAEIEISPSKKHLYVSNRGNGAILAFEILPDGNLDLVQIQNVDGPMPRHFKIHPNGQYMLVALQENKLLTFGIDANSGLLSKIDEKDCPNTPTFIGLLQL